MPVDINLTTVDPGTRYPSPVLGQNAADLVNVYFFFPFFTPEFIDFNGGREGLFRNDKCIKICLEC